MELLTQQVQVSNDIMDNKLFSRNWVWDNIFDLNEGQKATIFNEIIDDKKQQYRMEQIEQEGNDPAESGVKDGADTDEDDFTMARKGEWGGDRRSGTGEKEFSNRGYNADDLKDATKYERERYGKRQFKGGSPLATSKGSTLVAKESLVSSLKKKFGTKETSILNEESLINDDKD